MIATPPGQGADLRNRIAQLRREVAGATDAYRTAAMKHDSENAMRFLRSRSALMRQLLEAQCQLLLLIRRETLPEEAPLPRAELAVKTSPVV